VTSAGIRRVESDDDLAHSIELRHRIDPLDATSVDDQRALEPHVEAPLRMLVDGRAHGFAGRFPGDRDAYVDVGVLPDARRQGLGGEIFAILVDHVRAHGWETILASASEADGIAWLGKRRFEEVDRMERVVLELSEATDASPPPRGVDLTDLASRPDLLPTLYELVVAGLADVPGDLARDGPSYETFLTALEPPSRRRDFVVLALDARRLVAMASLNVYPPVGWHAFTTVACSDRSRGLARAVKLELIRRAKAVGLERLITQSNVDNVAMRTLNAELGYCPASPRLFFRATTAEVPR
jgi:GNAT superfamily N-acetyltransferase/RimJ/RimL family protein N-acetyltransferase